MRKRLSDAMKIGRQRAVLCHSKTLGETVHEATWKEDRGRSALPLGEEVKPEDRADAASQRHSEAGLEPEGPSRQGCIQTVAPRWPPSVGMAWESVSEGGRVSEWPKTWPESQENQAWTGTPVTGGAWPQL